MNGFITIRQAAQEGIMPEYRLRMRLKEKRLPGIYAGTKFMINRAALLELLERESKASLEEE